MRHSYLLFISVIYLMCQSFILSAQEDSTMLNLQKQVFPQEKVHLMTDTECYMPGDTVWMRLWIQNGETLKDSELGTRYVYVELRDSDDSMLKRIKIEESEGRFVGQMVLPDAIATGHYVLVAYTMYMLGTSVNTYFQKPLHIIRPQDVVKGTMPKSLLSSTKNIFETLPITEVIRRNDTLTRVSIPVPDSTWFAVSVTDDRYATTNHSYNIEYRLPRVPNLFTLNSVAKQSEIYTPVYPIEQKPVLFGTLVTNQKKQLLALPARQVVISDVYTGKTYTTVTDSVGSFQLDISDLKERSSLVYVPTAIGEDIEQIYYPLLDSIPQKYRIKNQQDYFISVDDVNQNESFEYYQKWALRRLQNDSINNIVKALSASPVANKYISYASEYIFKEDFIDESESGKRKSVPHKVYEIIPLFPRVHLSILPMGVAIYSNASKEIELRFIIGDTEESYESFASGLAHYQKSMDFPLSLVESIEFIDPETAAQHFPNPKFPNSGIIHIMPQQGIEDYSQAKLLNYNLMKLSCLGSQDRLRHNNFKTRTDEPQTIYWNPECYSGTQGTISLDIPIPNSTHTTYTVRLEGVQPSGVPISLIYRISK